MQNIQNVKIFHYELEKNLLCLVFYDIEGSSTFASYSNLYQLGIRKNKFSIVGVLTV